MARGEASGRARVPKRFTDDDEPLAEQSGRARKRPARFDELAEPPERASKQKGAPRLAPTPGAGVADKAAAKSVKRKASKAARARADAPPAWQEPSPAGPLAPVAPAGRSARSAGDRLLLTRMYGSLEGRAVELVRPDAESLDQPSNVITGIVERVVIAQAEARVEQRAERRAEPTGGGPTGDEPTDAERAPAPAAEPSPANGVVLSLRLGGAAPGLAAEHGPADVQRVHISSDAIAGALLGDTHADVRTADGLRVLVAADLVAVRIPAAQHASLAPGRSSGGGSVDDTNAPAAADAPASSDECVWRLGELFLPPGGTSWGARGSRARVRYLDGSGERVWLDMRTGRIALGARTSPVVVHPLELWRSAHWSPTAPNNEERLSEPRMQTVLRESFFEALEQQHAAQRLRWATKLGAGLIGSWVSVYWDGDDVWFDATVISYDPQSRCHGLLYSADGQLESLQLASAKWVYMHAGDEEFLHKTAETANAPRAEILPRAVFAPRAKVSGCLLCGRCREAEESELLSCAGCCGEYHLSCLERTLNVASTALSGWRCVLCKLCETCGVRDGPTRLATCELCDRAHHIGCLDPPLKSFPARGFRCPDCVFCLSCGSRSPGPPGARWTHGHTMCAPCGALYGKGKFCPICHKVYRDNEANMIGCDSCNGWVHTACDKIDDDQFRALGADEDKPYRCPNCRGERTVQMHLDALAKLSREDKDRFFAEPVLSHEAPNYHTIIERPMDFSTMRGKATAGAYGDDQAFRDDFSLLIENALTFNRPDTRIGRAAKNLARVGDALLDTLFPHTRRSTLEPSGDAPSGERAGAVSAPAQQRAQSLLDLAHPAACELVFGAHLAELHNVELCAACGSGDGDGAAGCELLVCAMCGEAYHTFCAPRLCGWAQPELTEETLRAWCCGLCKACDRCSSRVWIGEEADIHAPAGGSDADGAPAGARGALAARRVGDGSRPVASTLVCELCDRAYHLACLPPGAAPVAGQPYRCGHCVGYCESCCASLRRSLTQTSLGRWCVDCAPNATRGLCCAVCSRVFDAEAAETQMVLCSACACWVHVGCDEIGESEYDQMANDELPYFCPSCRDPVLARVIAQQRALQRVVTRTIGERIANAEAHVARMGGPWSSAPPSGAGALLLAQPPLPLPPPPSGEGALLLAQPPLPLPPPPTATNALLPARVHLAGGDVQTLGPAGPCALVAPAAAQPAVAPHAHDDELLFAPMEMLDALAPSDGAAEQAELELEAPDDARADGGADGACGRPPTPPRARADMRMCTLCRGRGDSQQLGRLLFVENDLFAHAQCVIWTSQVFEKKDGTLVDAVPAVKRARKQPCAHCGEPGASVGCDVKRCHRIFHLPCAAPAGCATRPASLTLVCAEHKTEDDAAEEKRRRDEAALAAGLRTRVRAAVRQKDVDAALSGLSERDRARELRRVVPPAKADAADPAALAAEQRAAHVMRRYHGGEAGLLARPLYCSRAGGRAGEADELSSAVLRIGALTCLRLGEIEPLRANSHDAHAIFPSGYVARRRYWSVVDPRERIAYTCEITADGADISARISFRISCPGTQNGFFAYGRTPLEAFSSLQKAITKARSTFGMSGAQAQSLWLLGSERRAAIFFGCGLPAIRRILQAMPGAAECVEYRPLAGSQAHMSDVLVPLPLSHTGCARTDGFMRYSSNFKHKYSCYLRPYMNRGAEPSRLHFAGAPVALAADSLEPAAELAVAVNLLGRRERARKQRESDKLSLPEKELSLGAQHRAMRQRIVEGGVKVKKA